MSIENSKNRHDDDYIKRVIESVEEFKKEGLKGFWPKSVEKLRKEYPNTYITIDSIRWIYRRHNPEHRDLHTYRKSAIDYEDGLKTTKERILARLKRKTDLNWLSTFLGVKLNEILSTIALLQSEGYNIQIWREDGDKLYARSFAIAIRGQLQDVDLHVKGETEIVLGFVGDTHLGSEFSAEEELQKAYDIMQERGITKVFHGGDVSEGWKSLRHETFLNNKAIGFQKQLEYISTKYPKRDGMKTYFIEGNHDLWVGKDALASFGKTLSMIRPDMVYLGSEFARIQVSPEVDITLYHPNDGSSRNVASKLQEFIERGEEKVSLINFIYHYHKVGMLQHNGSYAFYGSSFQRQSDWMNIKNLASRVGFWILTIKLNKDGDLYHMIPEYFSFEKTPKRNK